jgi:hypothetical protein
LAFEDSDLVPEGDDFKSRVGATTEEDADHGEVERRNSSTNSLL